MNYKFRGFSQFSRSFFNNKNQFKILTSQVNQNSLKINFSNKSFLSRILHLNASYGLLAKLLNKSVISSSVGSSKDLYESENGELQQDVSEGLALLGEVYFYRDDCKWTCGTRLLVSGPQSPVLVRTGIS
jgi:hypothetical protein